MSCALIRTLGKPDLNTTTGQPFYDPSCLLEYLVQEYFQKMASHKGKKQCKIAFYKSQSLKYFIQSKRNSVFFFFNQGL